MGERVQRLMLNAVVWMEQGASKELESVTGRQEGWKNHIAKQLDQEEKENITTSRA